MRWVGITVAAAGIAGASLTTQAQPPKANCRAVSKLEYSIDKKEDVIISQAADTSERDRFGEGIIDGATSSK